MKKYQGFSLIELLIILGLIGILAVVAMGFFGRGPIQKSKFTSAMNNFIADFL